MPHAIIDADEFQFVIADSEGDLYVEDDYGDVGFMFVLTGIHWGPLDVTAELRDAPRDIEERWESVYEVSVRTRGALCVAGLYSAPAFSITDLPGSTASACRRAASERVVRGTTWPTTSSPASTF